MSTTPVVAVIHATAASLSPVRSAFEQTYPEADLWHLLDDRLVRDADAAGGLTDELRARMSSLISYAVEGGADAVQLACSMYGPVAEAQAISVPVLPSDEAMFDEVARLKPGRVGVLASLAPSAEDTVERLTAHLAAAGIDAVVEGLPVAAALAATTVGDTAMLQEVLGRAAVELAARVDVIVIAQYSLSPARDAVAAAVTVPVLSPPHLAAERLMAVLTGQDPS